MTSILSHIAGNRPLMQTLEILEERGHVAHLVGGAPRNALLGKPIKDFDISTNARPEEVTQIFEACGMPVHPTGIDHGTVTVANEGEAFEITTWRKDVATDGRRATIAWADRIEDDAKRRDFTMNALYADRHGKIHDPTGLGLSDIAARRVRFIGSAEERIREDALRILRFYRFCGAVSGRVNLTSNDYAATREHADLMQRLSRERVGFEMRSILSLPQPGPVISAMTDAGVLGQVFPGAEQELAGAGKRLASLEKIEAAIQLAPNPMRRLVLVHDADNRAALVLNKAEMREERLLRLGSRDGMSPAEAGFRHGAALGADMVAIRAARAGKMLAESDLDNLRKGASSPMPLRASDLGEAFAGKAMGDALRRAEARWIRSGFSASPARLRNAALGEDQDVR